VPVFPPRLANVREDTDGDSSLVNILFLGIASMTLGRYDCGDVRTNFLAGFFYSESTAGWHRETSVISLVDESHPYDAVFGLPQTGGRPFAPTTDTGVYAISTFGTFGSVGTFGSACGTAGTFGCVGTAGCSSNCGTNGPDPLT
jgi:hypothetical protein